MLSADVQFKRLLEDVIMDGETVVTRNSKVRRLFGVTCRFDKTPLVTGRKTAWKNALREWEWFMSGSNKIADLHPSVRSWWEPFAVYADDLGLHVPGNYSEQFRRFYGRNLGKLDTHHWVDQIGVIVNGLKEHPFSRRNVITTWNTADMVHPSTPITNCHGTIIQTFVNPDDSLHLLMYQRSCDVMVGLQHNWFQYWAFLLWLCHAAGKQVGTFTWVGGDVHLYDVHNELAVKVLSSPFQGDPPELVYTPVPGIWDFRADDFSLDRAYAPTLLDRAEMVV